MRSYVSFAALLSITAGFSHAQIGKFENYPNFPNGPTHILDVQSVLSAATNKTVNACLGVEIDNFGAIWVTARRSPTTPTTIPHELYELRWNTTKKVWDVTAHNQPSSTQGSSWGIRDLAYDGKLHLYGGCEFTHSNNKIFAFNVITKKWDAARDVTMASSTVGTPRALAFDATGDSGRGSLWFADFTSSHYETDLTGKVLRTFPNVMPSCYGAAFDPDRETVWWFGQSYDSTSTGSAYPQVTGAEMRVKDGQPTGNRFISDRGVAPSSASYHAGGIAGGMAFYKDSTGKPLFLCLHQALSDTVVQLYGRWDYGKTSDGVLSMNDHACSSVVLSGKTQSSFGLRVTQSSANAVVPILGFSKTSVPLAVPGFAPGTSLFVLPTVLGTAAPVTAGTADLPFPIPNDKNLNQLGLYFQLLGVHSGGNFSLSTTNGGEAAINNI